MTEVHVLIHHGIKGQRWGYRRFQNGDGTLTEAGKRRKASKADQVVTKVQSKENSSTRKRASKADQVVTKVQSKNPNKGVKSSTNSSSKKTLADRYYSDKPSTKRINPSVRPSTKQNGEFTIVSDMWGNPITAFNDDPIGRITVKEYMETRDADRSENQSIVNKFIQRKQYDLAQNVETYLRKRPKLKDLVNKFLSKLGF